MVFWIVSSCSSMTGYRSFCGIYGLYLQGWSVSVHEKALLYSHVTRRLSWDQNRGGKERNLVWASCEKMVKPSLFLNLHTSTLKMQAECFTDMSVSSYRTTQDITTLKTTNLIIMPCKPENFIAVTDWCTDLYRCKIINFIKYCLIVSFHCNTFIGRCNSSL